MKPSGGGSHGGHVIIINFAVEWTRGLWKRDSLFEKFAVTG